MKQNTLGLTAGDKDKMKRQYSELLYHRFYGEDDHITSYQGLDNISTLGKIDRIGPIVHSFILEEQGDVLKAMKKHSSLMFLMTIAILAATATQVILLLCKT